MPCFEPFTFFLYFAVEFAPNATLQCWVPRRTKQKKKTSLSSIRIQRVKKNVSKICLFIWFESLQIKKKKKDEFYCFAARLTQAWLELNRIFFFLEIENPSLHW